MVRVLSVVSAALVIAACSNPTEVQTDIITARVESSAIAITNTSQAPVYYFLGDRDALASMLWAICRDPDHCENVPPGSSKSVPFSEVAGYSAGTSTVTVFHWQLLRAPGGSYQPDSVRGLNVSLNR